MHDGGSSGDARRRVEQAGPGLGPGKADSISSAAAKAAATECRGKFVERDLRSGRLHAGGVLANSQGLSAKRDTPGLTRTPMIDPSGVADRVAVALKDHSSWRLQHP